MSNDLGSFKFCPVTGQPHEPMYEGDHAYAYGYEINRVEFDEDGFVADLDGDRFCRDYISLPGMTLLWGALQMREQLRRALPLLERLAVEEEALRRGVAGEPAPVQALANEIGHYLRTELHEPLPADDDLFLEYRGVRVYHCIHDDMLAQYRYTTDSDNNDIDNPWPMDGPRDSMFDVRDLPFLESDRRGGAEEAHRGTIVAAIHFGLLTEDGYLMPETKVVHIDRAQYDVYIGRANPRKGLAASIFANPFKIGELTRFEAVERYEIYARGRMAVDKEFRDAVKGLRGKRLGCWCAPLLCHGHILARLAEEE
ncbi:MAG: hypothetical protein FOGNACKC_00734 [Anaerolineae bacterium]|nr:hypothetical protein [Anaerolineae bacterium]